MLEIKLVFEYNHEYDPDLGYDPGASNGGPGGGPRRYSFDLATPEQHPLADETVWRYLTSVNTSRPRQMARRQLQIGFLVWKLYFD